MNEKQQYTSLHFSADYLITCKKKNSMPVTMSL